MVDPIRVKGNIVGVFGIAIPSSDDLPRPFGTEELSPRQLDVLRLLVQGKSTNQIAADLHLAPETVRNYVGSLLKTLGAQSRSRQLSSRFGTASSPWIWTEGPGPAGPWAELLARSDCRTIRPWLASSGSSSGSCKALRTWSGSAPGTTGRSHFSAARSSTCSAVARPASDAVRDGPERA